MTRRWTLPRIPRLARLSREGASVSVPPDEVESTTLTVDGSNFLVRSQTPTGKKLDKFKKITARVTNITFSGTLTGVGFQVGTDSAWRDGATDYIWSSQSHAASTLNQLGASIPLTSDTASITDLIFEISNMGLACPVKVLASDFNASGTRMITGLSKSAVKMTRFRLAFTGSGLTITGGGVAFGYEV